MIIVVKIIYNGNFGIDSLKIEIILIQNKIWGAVTYSEIDFSN